MIEFNFNSQVATTIEQSERLIALGLKKDTADMHYCMCEDGDGSEYPILLPTPNARKKDIPAWSLYRLWELTNIRHIILDLQDEIPKLYDEVITHIEKSIKEGDFNKNYLNEE